MAGPSVDDPALKPPLAGGSGAEPRTLAFAGLDIKPVTEPPARIEHGRFRLLSSEYSVRSTTSDPTTLRVRALKPEQSWVLVLTGFRTPDLAATWIGDWATCCATWRWLFVQQVFRTYYGCSVNRDGFAPSVSLAGVR